jgi:hypothetical protein
LPVSQHLRERLLRYEKCISYLALSGRKIAMASRAEKDLCYNLTTGWGDKIDLATWNALNTHYYSAISPTTGEENLFTKHYDLLLEGMLPQFALSKVKLAKPKQDWDELWCLTHLLTQRVCLGVGVLHLRRGIPLTILANFGKTKHRKDLRRPGREYRATAPLDPQPVHAWRVPHDV